MWLVSRNIYMYSFIYTCAFLLKTSRGILQFLCYMPWFLSSHYHEPQSLWYIYTPAGSVSSGYPNTETTVENMIRRRLFLMKFEVFDTLHIVLSQEAKYGGPQVHTKFKSLTPNLNHSHLNQITRAQFKSPTPNSNY